MRSFATLAAVTAVSLAFAAAAALDLAPWLRGPAPYPPEWQWELRQPVAGLPLPALLLAALVPLLIAASGLHVVRRRERAAARALELAAVLLGLALPLALLGREPGGALRALLARTASFSVTSYHTAALSDEARDPLAFVRRHAELLPDFARSAKHAATHPVGPVLLFRAAVAACERSPRLTDALLRAAGLPEREFAPPLTRAARAGALVGALGLALFAAATAWPLAALSRALGLAPLAAASAALLWTLLPGPALVAPRFDAAVALPVTAYALLLLHAQRGARPLGKALAAGGCGGIALLLSYGAAAFLAIAGLAASAVALRPRPDGAARGAAHEEGAAPAGAQLARAGLALLVSAAVALALAFGLPALAGGHPLDALRTALAIHRDAYTAPRSYALWLLFDPVDFAALVGVPVALLAGAAGARAFSDARREPPAAAHSFVLVVLAFLAVLVVSGVARGEVGRLWIPLMPLLLAGALHDETPRGAALVACLTAVCTLAIASAWRL